ncbi:hypothetical protein CBOM_01280 [Ceraceosorus bombacis]|uniref:Uncharacterized protein n=1 Tax=Ceraceosorus bombacis TaxID=401625 RepID=A0A0P1BC61_9BASI|nr:hypothetical protein CBOM_01280 [Ceraceosorus bombacis]
MASPNTSTISLHAAPLVLYRGPHTYLSFTLSSASSDNVTDSVKVQLVRRGWRAGVFGWNAAKWLGARERGVDVTPVHESDWENAELVQDQVPTQAILSAKRRANIQQDLARKTEQAQSQALELGVEPLPRYHTTMTVRLPASEGDGYFHLLLTTKQGENVRSPTFRIYSVSLSSACPRGASLLPPTIIPELILRTLSAMLYTALLALSPLGFLARFAPRGITRWVGKRVYRAVGGNERRDEALRQYGVQDKLDSAKKAVERVPFATAGVRTAWDVQRDQELGRGGVRWIRR